MNNNYVAKKNYFGQTAKEYDKKRHANIKWQKELDCIQEISGTFKEGAKILDVPVGTGRFLPFYLKDGNVIFGLDASTDMINEAKQKVTLNGNNKFSLCFLAGDAEKLPFKNCSFDHVVCIRLLNWMSLDIVKNILQDLKRISKKDIIVSIRVHNKIPLLEYINLIASNTKKNLLNFRATAVSMFKYFKIGIMSFCHLFMPSKGPSMSLSDIERGYQIHAEQDVLDMFDDLKLELMEQKLINESISLTKREKRPYSIYFLEGTEVSK